MSALGCIARSVPRVGAFSLLEMLVAMAVLSIMMAFMFNALGLSFRAWETGNRQIEAAQAARIGLDRIARDFRYTLAESVSMPAGGADVITNTIPFFTTNSGSSGKSIPGESPANFVAPPFTGMLFGVSPIADLKATNGPFAEIGFFPVFVANPQGVSVLASSRYYLIWHSPSTTVTNASISALEPRSEFYFRGTPSLSWIANASQDTITSSGNRMALVEGCYQMQLQFATNSPSGLSFTNVWTNQDTLPAGILVTLKVMDSKTAARIIQLNGTNVFRPEDLGDSSTNPAARLRREGTVEVTRFIPLVNSTN